MSEISQTYLDSSSRRVFSDSIVKESMVSCHSNQEELGLRRGVHLYPKAPDSFNHKLRTEDSSKAIA